MSHFAQTALIASIVVVIAVLAMAIGWLLTGKSRMQRGCGRDPTKRRGEECGQSRQCDLCDHSDDNKK